MRTIRIKAYKFNELNENAKQEAIRGLQDINVDFEWWDATYEDASNVGLKITSFGLDRDRHATGELILDGETVIAKVLEEHGEECGTYKTAMKYKKTFDDFGKMSEECAISDDVEDAEHELLNDLLEDYSIMLQKESEYLMSDEAVIETIESNECEFTKEGKRI